MLSKLRPLMVAITVVLSFTAIAFADGWNGNWSTNFGQLRLLQNGDRLYGDYAERGVIEGKISHDGTNARAVFLYNDGRWGTVSWRRDQGRINGSWAWSHEGLAKAKTKSWTGTRATARTSPLKFAAQTRRKYPRNDPQFREVVRAWIDDVARKNAAPRPKPQLQIGARDGLSPWYGGYSLSNTDPGFSIGAEVIHFERANTASVDISIFVDRSAACPKTLHIGFCKELKTKADSRGYVKAKSNGVIMLNLGRGIGEVVRAQFRLPGDRTNRMLLIGRETTYFRASIMHPERGYDYVGYAKARANICEQAQCTDAVFQSLRNSPRLYRSGYDRVLSKRLVSSKNDIAQSHNSSSGASQQASRSKISDTWVILDETSENLGEISVSPDGNRLAASGKLRGFFETGEGHETIFTRVASTDEAIAFDLTVYAGQSGEQKQGRLIVELPAFAQNNPRGTLIVGDDIFLVELVRPTPGLEPKDVGDTPAIGIYSVNYALRDVPANQQIRLRAGPNRSSKLVGFLASSASDLQVLNCIPEINSLQFTEASFDKRLSMLDRAWCQVTNNQAAGWILGRYLIPNKN